MGRCSARLDPRRETSVSARGVGGLGSAHVQGCRTRSAHPTLFAKIWATRNLRIGPSFRLLPYLQLWGWARELGTSQNNADSRYVYQTEANNYESFITSLKAAMTTPIQPYIPDRLTREALDARMNKFVMHDWRSEAERILDNRKNGHESEVGENLGMFEL